MTCQEINIWTHNEYPDVITRTMLRWWTTSFTTDKEKKKRINTCKGHFCITQFNKIYFQLVIINAFLLLCGRVVMNTLRSFIAIHVISLHKAHECIHKWTQLFSFLTNNEDKIRKAIPMHLCQHPYHIPLVETFINSFP